MQMAIPERRVQDAEKRQQAIRFVKQNYKGLYAMSQWLESRKKTLAARQEAAAAPNR